MPLTVLLTGATGALGPHLLSELLRSPAIGRIYAIVRRDGRVGSDRLGGLWKAVAVLSAGAVEHGQSGGFVAVDGDLRHANLGVEDAELARLVREVEVIVHAGADTRFGAPVDELYDTNVNGTRQMLSVGQRCARLRQVILVSTTCVAGTRTGSIVEGHEEVEPRFVNEYERTKWQAERLATAAGLPVRIARLSTCIGGQRSGYVHRLGAIHYALHWLMRGLIPMLPGASESRMDLIASDVAAQWIARAAATPVDRLEVCHIAAGHHAIALNRLLAFVVGHFRERHPAWRGNQINPPVVVRAETFDLFRRSAIRTGDPLLVRVLESASTFLPGLLYPKVYQTACAERLWGGPLPSADCRPTLAKVVDFICGDGRTLRRDVEARHA